MDDLITAGGGEGPVVGAVDGGGESVYRGHPAHQVGDLERRVLHRNLGVRSRDLGQLAHQGGEGSIVFGLE